MEEKFAVNPFDRSALRDYRQLAARSEELRQIRFILRNASKNPNRIKSILITGERGVGKTSFLNLIEEESRNFGVLSIRINLTHGNTDNANDFFWLIFSQCINTILDLGYLGGKGGEVDNSIREILNPGSNTRPNHWTFKMPFNRRNYLLNNLDISDSASIIDDLKLIMNAVSQEMTQSRQFSKLLFLIDESQHIYQQRRIIEDIRFIIQCTELGVGFVFAGDNTYKSSLWEDVFGGSYRDFEVIRLSYFESADDVVDFFKKSLSTIGWTEKEIEEDLFYRLKVSCRHIFQLTSGKPSWITVVASKMFERCMKGEVRVLKFDKQAQNNVKKMLQDSGEIDPNILSYIEDLPKTYKDWLSELFACELQTFEKVFFFSKFKLADVTLSLEEYIAFCRELLSKKILLALQKDETGVDTISFKVAENPDDLLSQYIIAFGPNSDTIKQWLQINSDGLFGFGFSKPANRFIRHISNELATEKGNMIVLGPRSYSDSFITVSSYIQKINNKEFDVNDEIYENVAVLFRLCKILSESRDQDVLEVKLENLNTGKTLIWNAYNYSDKDRIIPFRQSAGTISKLKGNVNKYNSEGECYSVDISIIKMPKPELRHFQDAIIKSGDAQKIGIVLNDKHLALTRGYVNDSNIELSSEISDFFYDCFVKGLDLELGMLNDAAYVFMEKAQYLKALELLEEATRKISKFDLLREDYAIAALIYYNSGMLNVLLEKWEVATNDFEQLLIFIEKEDLQDSSASVLKILGLDENQKIRILEVREKTAKRDELNYQSRARENLRILQEHNRVSTP